MAYRLTLPRPQLPLIHIERSMGKRRREIASQPAIGWRGRESSDGSEGVPVQPG